MAAFLAWGSMTLGAAQEIRPGIWASSEARNLPLPTSGYQAYMLGELHGIQENEAFEIQYLAYLNQATGLRDVAIEEDAVYEADAQAYVDGKSDNLSEHLCLRAGIINAIRSLNARLMKDKRIRIHLTDVDSPDSAIRAHLAAIKNRIPGAAKVEIPKAGEIKSRGLETVTELRSFDLSARERAELRTVEHSVRVCQEGFEVDVGPAKGSPYLEDREEAVACNIEDLLRGGGVQTLLVLYGGDHVSRSLRADGGPSRDRPFAPLALRLSRSDIKLFCIEMFPLTGESFWRGRRMKLPWTIADNKLASGETFADFLPAAAHVRFLYLSAGPQHPRLASQDISNYDVDAYLLFPSGTPMKDYRASP